MPIAAFGREAVPKALRIAAAAIAAAAIQHGVWSLARKIWFGEPLAVLPDPHAGFVVTLLTPFWVVVVLPLVLMLIKMAGAALILLALAEIVERVDTIGSWVVGAAGSTSRPPAGLPPSRRLVRLRVLRIAAVVVFIAWVGQPAFLFLSRLATDGGAFHDTYFVAGTSSLLLPALVGAAFALVTLAFATILDRLDRLGARSDGTTQ